MNALPGLRGCRVLVTRPAEQAEALCALISAAGGVPLRLPLLRIEPAAVTPALREQLAAAKHSALVLFTSANAVRCAVAIQPEAAAWPAAIAVVGEATAGAVRAAGLPAPVLPAHDYSSEGLLALPQFAALGGKQILLVTGRNGREVLAKTLRARGANVQRVEVYERIPAAVTPAAVTAALEAAVIVVTSGETLERLAQVTPAAVRSKLLTRALVVPSDRVSQMARQFGFGGAIALARPMSDAGILQALATLTDCESGPSQSGAAKNAGAEHS